MAVITKTISADERTWQAEFYKTLFGEDSEDIKIDRSTDGYTKGILFEHKTNIRSYGESKALGQALIYLTRFNRDGVPVPAKICLVGQEEQKCYIYDTQNYMHIVGDIPKYANMKASDGIPGFTAGVRSDIISFDMANPLRGMQALLTFVQMAPQTVKVDINVHNVYGWASYYYDHAAEYKQKPEKKKFFEELRDPKGTLEAFINPWTGKETDFKYIMDMLNDPMTQKKLGAFYTPPAYAKKASELVKQAIERVPAGNDYVIIDRCAGTGNLEMYLDDGGEDILSHCILSTYELKEWMVLKDRYYGRVRYIIPPVPRDPTVLPALNEDGFLSGANALTRDIIDNPEVRKYLDDPGCTIILYENPPYVESTSTKRTDTGKTAFIKTKSSWKSGALVQEMAREVSGVATNDMGNAFIWTAFRYFLRQSSDSYIVFSPVKYWKAHHLVNKKFINGFAFNRKHFHASTDACIMCALWSNEDDCFTNEINIKAINLDENNCKLDEGSISVKRIYSSYSDVYFDTRSFSDLDIDSSIVAGFDGAETSNAPTGISPVFNNNILGYMLVSGNTFDNPRLSAVLLTIGIYKGHGFYLRSDNFLEKLPMFAASRYTDHCNDWKIMSMVMKSGDKAAQYEADVKSGKLDIFLFKCLFWTCMSHYPHMRSLHGSDGRLYLNQLCFDGDTLARQKMDEFITKGYKLTEQEQEIWDKMQDLLQKIKKECKDEYLPEFKYGLYQIDEEINIKIQQGYKKDGKPNMVIKYGDINNMIKDLKALVKQYYLDNLVDTLFEYEFLK